jgi:hypothetical protein
MKPTVQETTIDDKTPSTVCISPASTMKSSSCSLSSRKTRRRSVKFASSAELTQEFPSADIREEDKEALWYTQNEYNLIQKSYHFIVKLMENKRGLLDDNEMCSRGLESRTRAGERRRRQQIEASVDAVLCEQEKQWEQNFLSTRWLAQIYRKSSAQSSMIAYLAAQKDAKAVQDEKQNHLCNLQSKMLAQRPTKDSESSHRQSSVRSE